MLLILYYLTLFMDFLFTGETKETIMFNSEVPYQSPNIELDQWEM